MERNITYTHTNIIDESISKFVKSYFEGASVKEAMKKVRTIEELKLKLDKLIVKNNFNLVAPEIIKLSQKLDKEVVKEQKKKAAL
ncbi:MAG: hypothetical protein ACI8WT_001727 [Clostridium sp.]|jgi:hypothetical protein